jgi:hypothetical protein
MRARTTRQVGASLAIVAFAAGAATSAGMDGVSEAFAGPAPLIEASVAPIAAQGQQLEVRTVTEEITLDPDRKEKDDPYAMRGTSRVVTEGEPGRAQVHYDVTYIDGQEVSRVETISVVVDPVTHEVVAVGSLVVPPATAAQAGSNRALGKEMAADLYGWTGDQWSCLDNLWKKESNWRHTAENKSSGAYGIPQALPGTKMKSAGSDWRTNPATQIKWGLGYIENRYGSPCKAWAHSQSIGWY